MVKGGTQAVAQARTVLRRLMFSLVSRRRSARIASALRRNFWGGRRHPSVFAHRAASGRQMSSFEEPSAMRSGIRSPIGEKCWGGSG